MPSASTLTDRLRRLAPEAIAFGVIGAGNTLLYFAITWVALSIGAVKASVLATVITTTLAYFANRYWTYRHHTRTALRREYTLFFGFNLVGMIIQSGSRSRSASTASASPRSTTSWHSSPSRRWAW